MSLINEALKKAQTRREAETASNALGATPSPAGERRKSPASFYFAVLLVAGAAVLVGTTILATAYALRSQPQPAVSEDGGKTSAPSKPAVVRLASGPAPQAATESPSLILPSSVKKEAPSAAQTASAPTASAAPASALSSAVPEEPKPMTPVDDQSAQESPMLVLPQAVGTPPPPQKQNSAPQPNPHAQAFVDAARVIGIRASGTESKVLMNERVYRLNEVVSTTLGLRLVEISTSRLVFEDPNGIRYTRSF